MSVSVRTRSGRLSKAPVRLEVFEEVEDDYREIIDELISDRFVDVGRGDVETAIINIKETFDVYRGQPWVAVSKLQQLRFLYALMTLPQKKRNDFCTSLIFLLFTNTSPLELTNTLSPPIATTRLI